MEVQQVQNGHFVIIRIREAPSHDSDLLKIRDTVKECFAKGHADIALSFEQDSFMNGKPLGLVIVCSEMAQKLGCQFAVVRPPHRIFEGAETVMEALRIRVLRSEDELHGDTLRGAGTNGIPEACSVPAPLLS